MNDDVATFRLLRDVLRAHADGFTVSADTPQRFCLDAVPGPATIAAWHGELRRPTFPVCWVERRKSYVGYHMMGLYGNRDLSTSLSPELRARMHGKTCFNFRHADETLLAELAEVTAASIAALRRGGFSL